MRRDCKEYFEKISEYLDGELDSVTCKKIEAHLQECPESRNCLDSLRTTVKICKEYPFEKIPEDVRQRLRTTLFEYLRRTQVT